MKDNVFSSLVSITKGLHRDRRTEREFKTLISELYLNPTASNSIFKITFKRPLNSKKEYFQKLIFNQTEKTIEAFTGDFPKNATTAENNYSYTILNNKFNKYLTDISTYINKRGVSTGLTNDNDYIINYLKVSAIRLYAELQEQYGEFSNTPKYTIPEILEKYFNDTTLDSKQLERINTQKSVVPTPKRKTQPKTSFNFKSLDTSTLLSVLKQLHLKIDLLDNRTSVEQLHKLLTVKDFTKTESQIYLQCETTQFSYIVSKLKPFFNSFNPTSIERSGKFITKTGTPLKANNLHKNKVHNPKEKEEIDKIIQQLQ